jgi:hypothetical protein
MRMYVVSHTRKVLQTGWRSPVPPYIVTPTKVIADHLALKWPHNPGDWR